MTPIYPACNNPKNGRDHPDAHSASSNLYSKKISSSVEKPNGHDMRLECSLFWEVPSESADFSGRVSRR